MTQDWTSADAYCEPGGAKDLPDLANETLGEVDFPLAARFAFRGVAYESLRLRVPNGRDMQAFLALPEAERTPNAWLSIILEAPREILDVIYAGDYAELIGVASRLSGRTLPTDKE